jgi:hypothetical protein
MGDFDSPYIKGKSVEELIDDLGVAQPDTHLCAVG